CQQHGESTLTF
nr:immunoglobulin light chain junction region [Macaca mulatta]